MTNEELIEKARRTAPFSEDGGLLLLLAESLEEVLHHG